MPSIFEQYNKDREQTSQQPAIPTIPSFDITEYVPSVTDNKLASLAEAKEDKLNTLGNRTGAYGTNYADTDYTGVTDRNGRQVQTTGVQDFVNQGDALAELMRTAQVLPSIDNPNKKVTLSPNYNDPSLIGPHRRDEFSETIVPKNRWGQDDVRSAYLKLNDQGTPDTIDDVAKFGLAASDLNDEAIARGMTAADARYSDLTKFWPYKHNRFDSKGNDSAYDGTPGPATSGEKTQWNLDFLKEPITKFELNRYMDRATIDARAMGTGADAEKNYGDYGGGAHEYTMASKDPLMVSGITAGNVPAEGTVTPVVPYGYDKTGAQQIGSYQDADLKARREAYLAESTQSSHGYLSNLIDGLQGAIGTTAARTGDMVVDAVTRLTKEAAQRGFDVTEEQANKFITDTTKDTALANMFDTKGDFVALDKLKQMSDYGYDDTAIKEYGEEFKTTMVDPEASVLDKIAVAAKSVVYFPEVLTTSVGDMILAVIPGGWGVIALNQANEVLEERANIQGTSDLDVDDYAIAGASGLIYGLVNQFTMGNAGFKPVSKLATEIVTSMSEKGAKAVVAKLGGMVANGLFKGLEEGGEEIVQGITEVVGQKYGTSKEGEILTQDTALDLALQGTLGFGAGLGSSTVKSAVSVVFACWTVTFI